MSVNSVQLNRLIARKQIVEEGWRKKTFADINTGTQLTPDDYNQQR
jgi:hypothetical protein